MKKTRLFFGAAALTFAFASALAFKAKPSVEYGYFTGTECVKTSACEGGSVACEREINGSSQLIRLWESPTSCGAVQTMEP